MMGKFWLLPLIVVALCVLMVLGRILQSLTPENPDRYRCIVLLGAAAIAGFSPWLLMARFEVSAGESKPLDFYLHHWAEWPFVAVHIWFAIVSVAMGVWLIFGRGAKFVARYSTVFVTRPLGATMARRFGWLLFSYPAVYFTALYALNR